MIGHADDDSVVPIPVVGKEHAAAKRLRALLAAAYGKDWSPAKLHQLLSDPAVDWADEELEDWLRNGFWPRSLQDWAGPETAKTLAKNAKTPRGVLSGFSVNWAVTQVRNR